MDDDYDDDDKNEPQVGEKVHFNSKRKICKKKKPVNWLRMNDTMEFDMHEISRAHS